MARVSEERTVTEQQYQREVNTAIANTEDEIFAEAMGDAELENSGDRTLEDMGEGLEGEHIDEEDVREDVDTEIDDDADDRDEDPDDAEEDDAEDDREIDPRDARGDRDDRTGRQERARAQAREDDARSDRRRGQRERGEPEDRDERRGGREERAFLSDRRGVPSWRLRQESENRRASDARSEDLRRELAVANARISDLTNRVNTLPAPQQRQQQQQDPEPDFFADPQAWQSWNRRQQEAIASATASAAVQRYRAEEMARSNDRIEASFQRAATSPGLKGLEFHAAYSTLTSLDPQDARNRELVQSIYHSQNPAAALLEWFEDEGYAAELRRDLRSTLDGGRGRERGRERIRERDRDRDYDREDDGRFARGRERDDYDRDPGRGRQQPRHEIRRRYGLPSLNGAGGSGSRRQNSDPDSFDNSDESVMEFAMRR